MGCQHTAKTQNHIFIEHWTKSADIRTMSSFFYLRREHPTARHCQLPVQNGFTLIELLITIAIVSILVGLAVVNMQSAFQRSQADEAYVNLRMDVNFARGEAIKRGGWVGFCGSENGTACTDSFQSGWLVFHDVDRNLTLGNLDTVLSWTSQEHSALSATAVPVEDTPDVGLLFNYRGYPNRSVLFTTTRGEATNAFMLNATGSIELK